jgi:hypothetical protein
LPATKNALKWFGVPPWQASVAGLLALYSVRERAAPNSWMTTLASHEEARRGVPA